MPAADVRFLRSRVLALRLCAAGGGGARRDVRPVPADAGPGQLQSLECAGPDHQGDRGRARRQPLRRQLRINTRVGRLWPPSNWRIVDEHQPSHWLLGGDRRACYRRLLSFEYPTAQSVAGLPPSGNVTITEDFVAGLGGGTGTLQYQGRSYPFKMLGTVAGPGGGVDKITASGPVYKLASVGDFSGRYTQSTGKAGFSSSGSSDLWLENNAGVIMHLQGTSTGAMLTLGKDEIIIRMDQ